MNTDKRFLLLHPTDNTVVCCQTVPANETIMLEGSPLTLRREIGLGHKLARCDIRAGEKIYKYGAIIGSAIADIARGEHVHLHNVKSDYMRSYIRSGIVSGDAPPAGAAP